MIVYLAIFEIAMEKLVSWEG